MEGSSTKRRKRTAAEETVRDSRLLHPPKETTANAETDERSAAAAAPALKHQMSRREIRSILNYKPMTFIPRVYEDLKRSNPDLKPSPEEEKDEAKNRLYGDARAFYESEENYPMLQEWVRQELAAKGYVEVDDEWVRQVAEEQAVVDEWSKKVEDLLLANPQTEDEDDDDSDSDSDYSDEEE